MWIVTGYTLKSGRKFYAAKSFHLGRAKWRATVVKDCAESYYTRKGAESAAIQFAVALPVFLGTVSVERLT